MTAADGEEATNPPGVVRDGVDVDSGDPCEVAVDESHPDHPIPHWVHSLSAEIDDVELRSSEDRLAEIVETGSGDDIQVRLGQLRELVPVHDAIVGGGRPVRQILEFEVSSGQEDIHGSEGRGGEALRPVELGRQVDTEVQDLDVLVPVHVMLLDLAFEGWSEDLVSDLSPSGGTRVLFLWLSDGVQEKEEQQRKQPERKMSQNQGCTYRHSWDDG